MRNLRVFALRGKVSCVVAAIYVKIKVMAKENGKIQNIMLALGLALFLLGVAWAFLPPVGQIASYHFILNCVLVLITAACVYFSLLLQKPFVFYVFMNLCILSLLSLILNGQGVMLRFKQFWPFVVIIFGIFKTVYVIPSASLTILGAFFFLFTFKIIKMPLREFFFCFLPFFFIAGGAALIILYYVRLNAKDKFPIIKEDEDDEPLLFSEDDC